MKNHRLPIICHGHPFRLITEKGQRRLSEIYSINISKFNPVTAMNTIEHEYEL